MAKVPDRYESYPVRCRCGTPIGQLSMKYKEHLAKSFTVGNALNAIHLMNYCCRATMMSPVTIFHDITVRAKIEGKTSAQVERTRPRYAPPTARPTAPATASVLSEELLMLEEIEGAPPAPSSGATGLSKPGIPSIGEPKRYDERHLEIAPGWTAEVLAGRRYLAD